FAKNGTIIIAKIIKMTVLSQKEILLSTTNWQRIATLWQLLQQSFRRMVGVPDYQTYLEHMKAHHPDLTPMDSQTVYRH
ncbi:YbdD/YjiX family protein, partial [Enterobacter hormaechei]|uniref:YbdD/YjiX family protein n=1 Tax=Enterobacter hormaechei TaxID=158836 RepID=UPI003CC62F53